MKKARKSDINLRDKITPKKLKIPVRIAILNWVASHPPSLGSFTLEIREGNKTITEAMFSLIFFDIVKSGQQPLLSKILDPPLMLRIKYRNTKMEVVCSLLNWIIATCSYFYHANVTPIESLRFTL